MAGKMIGVVEIWSAVKFLTHSPNYSPCDTFCFRAPSMYGGNELNTFC